MKRKIIFLLVGAIIFTSGSLFGEYKANLSHEIIIGNEELLGGDNNFGTTVAIYVEQNEGQGDYIQKNNVPTENVYVVNARTHCVGGGI